MHIVILSKLATYRMPGYRQWRDIMYICSCIIAVGAWYDIIGIHDGNFQITNIGVTE